MNQTIEISDFKNQIMELKNKKGSHTELVSLYIPFNKKISDISNYLKKEIAQSRNIKTKIIRKNVINSISSILGQLPYI